MSEHRGVPAAEKYAELLANGQERPRCACHGKTMVWGKGNYPQGGCWRCAARKHRGITAAEKYSELLADGVERPLCACHGEAMYWAKNSYLVVGGRWACGSARRGSRSRYRLAHAEKIATESFGRKRRRSGIPLDYPLTSMKERGRLGARLQALRKAVANQHAMNVIERTDSRQAQLMRLAVNEGASPYERRRALEKLDQHLATKLKGSDPAWQHSKITSEGTRTPQPLPRSTYC